MKKTLTQRKVERARDYQSKYKYSKSTARKKAGTDERLIENMKTGYEEIEYQIKGCEVVRIKATLINDKELHYQYPGSAFIRVREVNSGELHAIPTECWIQRVRKSKKED